jgi:hypothetical protein
VSRVLYYDLGVRFDSVFLYYGLQVLDVRLLQQRLLESIINLHSQPPMFNLLLGAVLKAFPTCYDAVFHVLFMAFGLGMSLSMLALSRRIGTPDPLALVLTLLFVVCPTAVLYENFLLYTYPVASLLCVATLLFSIWVRTSNRIAGVASFSCMALVILTRSVFQIPWFVAACALAIATGRFKLRTAASAAVLPLAILCLWQAKNYYLFGTLTTSTWLGLNLSRNTVERLRPDEVIDLMRIGSLSPLAPIPALSSYDLYEGRVPTPPVTGVPALDWKEKNWPSIGPNYNYIGYIEVSSVKLRDAVRVIASDPARFACHISDAVGVWLMPASDGLMGTMNTVPPGILRSLFVIEGKSGFLRWLPCGLVFLCYAVASVYGTAATIRLLRAPDRAPTDATIAFMWLTVAYSAIVVNLTEIWENNRMRFMTDPLVWIMVGAALTEYARRLNLMRIRAQARRASRGQDHVLRAPLRSVSERIQSRYDRVDFSCRNRYIITLPDSIGPVPRYSWRPYEQRCRGTCGSLGNSCLLSPSTLNGSNTWGECADLHRLLRSYERCRILIFTHTDCKYCFELAASI